jgi:ABC-type branched-subunit amino acid transport system ATPase component
MILIFNEIELTILLPHEIVHNGVVQIPEERKLFPCWLLLEALWHNLNF